jgi:hypothetical protein
VHAVKHETLVVLSEFDLVLAYVGILEPYLMLAVDATYGSRQGFK